VPDMRRAVRVGDRGGDVEGLLVGHFRLYCKTWMAGLGPAMTRQRLGINPSSLRQARRANRRPATDLQFALTASFRNNSRADTCSERFEP
jgi:hypothetical protein